MSACLAPDCDRVATTRDMCKAHYHRLMRGRPMEPPVSDRIRRRCEIQGCGDPAVGRGLCRGHYTRWYKGLKASGPIRRQDRSLAERFWAMIMAGDPSACWEWRGARDKRGYGKLKNPSGSWLASRISYELNVGAIPAGLNVLHSCDNPPCVNPGHLHLGTQANNIQEMYERGRGRMGAA